jgi:hypothetical protein
MCTVEAQLMKFKSGTIEDARGVFGVPLHGASFTDYFKAY